jgi:hypothetical protein
MSANPDYKTKLAELIAERNHFKNVGNHIKEEEFANKINKLKIDTNYGKLPMPTGTGGKSNKKSKKQRGKRFKKTRRNKRWSFF